MGRGESIEEINRTSKGVVEGVQTLNIIREIAREKNLDMPVTETIYQLLHGQIKMEEAEYKLMTLELRPEFPTLERPEN